MDAEIGIDLSFPFSETNAVYLANNVIWAGGDTALEGRMCVRIAGVNNQIIGGSISTGGYSTFPVGVTLINLQNSQQNNIIGVYFDGLGSYCIGVNLDSSSSGNIISGCHFDTAFLPGASPTNTLFAEDPNVQGQNTFLSNGSDESLQNLPCNIAGQLGIGVSRGGFQGTGQVTINAGQTSVTGGITGSSQTFFESNPQFSVGDQIMVGSQSNMVTAIGSDSSLTVFSPWSSSSGGLVNYVVIPAATLTVGGAAGGGIVELTSPSSWGADNEPGAVATLNLGDTNQAIMGVWGSGMVFQTYNGGGNAFRWRNQGFPTDMMTLVAGTTGLGGHLGIGTTAPSQKLEVNGNIQVDGYVSVNGPRILSGTGNPSSANPPLSAPQGSLYIRTDATEPTDRIWVNANGSSTGWVFLTASS